MQILEKENRRLRRAFNECEKEREAYLNALERIAAVPDKNPDSYMETKLLAQAVLYEQAPKTGDTYFRQKNDRDMIMGRV
jgi:hypothetical protein